MKVTITYDIGLELRLAIENFIRNYKPRKKDPQDNLGYALYSAFGIDFTQSTESVMAGIRVEEPEPEAEPEADVEKKIKYTIIENSTQSPRDTLALVLQFLENNKDEILALEYVDAAMCFLRKLISYLKGECLKSSVVELCIIIELIQGLALRKALNQGNIIPIHLGILSDQLGPCVNYLSTYEIFITLKEYFSDAITYNQAIERLASIPLND